MTVEEQVKKLLDERINDYKQDADSGFQYPTLEGNGRLWKRIEKKIRRVIVDDRIGSSIGAFEDLSRWHLRYSQFNRVHLNNTEKQQVESIKACWYGYLAVRAGDETYDCIPGQHLISLRLASQYWAQCILASWWDEAKELGQRFINSINYGVYVDERGRYDRRIMGKGLEFAPAGWFLLELHCKQHNADFDREKADYPELFIPYQEVLEKWNSPDMQEIDRLVYLLSDMHVQQTEQQDEDIAEEDEDYFEFGSPLVWLYPYEILAWLAIRKKMGLENPTEFSHPLMNQPLAQSIAGAPFPKPKLKEAEQLLEKLRESCPEADL